VVSVAYFDTSALVKRYIAEPGSDWIKTVLDDQAPNVFTSLITPSKQLAHLLDASVKARYPRKITTSCRVFSTMILLTVTVYWALNPS